MLEMLPYPSGDLHMGHVLNYTLGDVVTHFRRRNGYTVLRPMGFDSFGLPAENAAIKEGGHPREITERNIASIGRQMRRMGWAIDWDREVSAHEPSFYRWTQWLFLKFFEHGLAYRKEAPVNWCPNDQTVLVERACRRRPLLAVRRGRRGAEHGAVVLQDHRVRRRAARRPRRRSTGPSAAKKIQTRLDRALRGRRGAVPRRGARPRHSRLHDPSRHAVRGDVLRRRAREPARRTARRRDGAPKRSRRTPHRGRAADRGAGTTRRRPASFTGRYATNPVNGERIPIWVADYVLMEYGTGAIMAVPAHDARDREFAETFDLPIVPGDRRRREADSLRAVRRAAVAEAAKREIIAWLERPRVRARRRSATACATGASRASATGAARSRSSTASATASSRCRRASCRCCCPTSTDYRPKGQPPLASNPDFINTSARSAAARRSARRTRWTRSSTRPGTSCATPIRTTTRLRSTATIVDYWMPIDQYVGGIDHVKGHLLYSRFFVKVLNDIGLVGFREPFQRLWHQGWVKQGGSKMSKSKGNVSSPDELVAAVRRGRDSPLHPVPRPGRPGHGLDAPKASRGWPASSSGCGASSDCGRRQPASPDGVDTPLARKAHETIARFTDDIGRRFVFNTPISAVMELVNELSKAPDGSGRAIRRRDGRLADPAVRSARRRGAVVDARPRAAVGDAVARRRRARCCSATRSSWCSR